MPTPIWKGPTNALILQPESGAITASDRIRSSDVYKVYRDFSITIPNRGTLGTGSRLGWVVSDATWAPERGQIAKYTINWEAGGPDCGLAPPSAEIKIDSQELYPKTERNKFFRDGSGNFILTTQTVALAYATMHAATPYARANAQDQLNGLSDVTQKTLGLALAAKLQRGEETYYEVGWRYSVVSYSFTLPGISRGGVIQTPSPQPSGGYFSTALSWLRLADTLESVGPINSMWKLSSTWLGGDGGYWDTDLYS